MFIYGLKGGENIFSQESKGNIDGSGFEKHDEADSVYKDLLKGEVTQSVRELRHEMYYSERKSNDYIYKGGGIAEKRNKVFDYDGHIEESDGHKVILVQDNIEDCGSLSDNIVDDYKTKNYRKFTLSVKRDFIPSFRIEEYTTKLVVKDLGDGNVILDIYVSEYPKQFNQRHKFFLSEVNRIYEGYVQSPIIDFDEIEFVSFRAYGCDDYRYFKYGNVKFADMLRFDGSFVFRFTATPVINGYDLIEDYFDAVTQKKSDEREEREGCSMDFNALAQSKSAHNADNSDDVYIFDDLRRENEQ